MKNSLSHGAIGVVGIICGLGIGLKVAQKDDWKVIREYRAYIEAPSHFKYDPRNGLSYVDDFPEIGPSLAALVAKGELNHVDLVFPNVPRTRDVTRYWMERCQAVEGIVEATGNPEYVEFKMAGVQPLHINIWFTDEAEDQVKKLISELESFSEKEPTGG